MLESYSEYQFDGQLISQLNCGLFEVYVVFREPGGF